MAAFLITMAATERSRLETIHRGWNLIVKSDAYISARELELFELSYRDAFRDTRLVFVHRDERFAVYRLEEF
jgi:hypothetical protein